MDLGIKKPGCRIERLILIAYFKMKMRNDASAIRVAGFSAGSDNLILDDPLPFSDLYIQ